MSQPSDGVAGPGLLDRVLDQLADSAKPLIVRAGVAVGVGLVSFILMRNSGSGVEEAVANQIALYITVAALLVQALTAFERPTAPQDRRLRPNPATTAAADLWTRRHEVAADLGDRGRAVLNSAVGADQADDRRRLLAQASRARQELRWVTSPSLEAAVWPGEWRERVLAQLLRAAGRGVQVRRILLLDPAEVEAGGRTAATRELLQAELDRGVEVRVLAADDPAAGALGRDAGCLVVDDSAYCELGPAGDGLELLLSTRRADVQRVRDAFDAQWAAASAV